MKSSHQRTRVLLVHPLGYRADAAGGDIARFANIMPPIGLASLAAWLDAQGFETTLVDCYAKPDSAARIREILQDRRPDFLGLSCTTSSFLDGARLAGEARVLRPGIRTVVGGPHVSALQAASIRDFPAFDFAVVGEGEQTLAELVSGGWERPAAVQGLVTRLAEMAAEAAKAIKATAASAGA